MLILIRGNPVASDLQVLIFWGGGEQCVCVCDSDLHALIVLRGQTEKHHSTIYCLEAPPVSLD